MKNTYLLLHLCLVCLMLSCSSEKVNSQSEINSDRQELLDQIINDSDFISLVKLEEETRLEIISGEYKKEGKDITKILLKSGGACESLQLDEVKKNSYLTKYFERSCNKNKLRKKFLESNQQYNLLTSEERLYVKKMVINRITDLTPEKALELIKN